MVLQLVRSPGAFMDRKVGQPTLRMEIVVVLLIGAVGAIGYGYVGMGILDDTNMESLRFPVLGMVAKPIIGIVVLWLTYSVGLHVLANRVFNSRGPIRRLLKLVAWALIPVAVGNLIQSIAVYLAFQDVDYAASLGEAQTAGLNSGIDAVMAEGTSDPLYLLVPIALILSVLASGYLLVYAVQNAKDLDRDDARKAVGVLVGVHLVYLLWEAATVAGNLG